MFVLFCKDCWNSTDIDAEKLGLHADLCIIATAGGGSWDHPWSPSCAKARQEGRGLRVVFMWNVKSAIFSIFQKSETWVKGRRSDFWIFACIDIWSYFFPPSELTEKRIEFELNSAKRWIEIAWNCLRFLSWPYTLHHFESLHLKDYHRERIQWYRSSKVAVRHPTMWVVWRWPWWSKTTWYNFQTVSEIPQLLLTN